MYEYSVPDDLHIAVDDNANELLLISIAAIGNISAEVLNENNPYRIIPADKSGVGVCIIIILMPFCNQN